MTYAVQRGAGKSAVMGRRRFFFNLGALGAAVLFIVASVAFGPGGVKGVGLGIGIACVVFCAWFASSLAHQRWHEGYLEFHAFGRNLGVWSVLAGAMASVATWEIVQAAVFRCRRREVAHPRERHRDRRARERRPRRARGLHRAHRARHRGRRAPATRAALIRPSLTRSSAGVPSAH